MKKTFFKERKRMHMRILIVILIYFTSMSLRSLSGQCPDKDSLWNRINVLRSSTTPNKNEQLTELLAYEGRMKKCSPKADSVYTYLLLSIGVTYYRLSDFIHAIQYTTQALAIIEANATSQAINKAYLSRYYYYLSIYYDSLKLIPQKNEAIDSCIANEIKSNSGYLLASLVLQDNVRDLYNKGEYNLCIDRSVLGEALIHKYYEYEDSMSHIFFFIYYKASALRSLKRFNEEEAFLQSKRDAFLRVKDKDYQGAIYSLFGYLYKTKGEFSKAVDYFAKAAFYDRYSTKKEITAKALNEIGLIYSDNFHLYQQSLKYYYQALAHANTVQLANANASDSFYVLGNIANVYVRLKLFDSAFFFFQRAFDKIKPGITENDLVLHIADYVNENTVQDVVKLVLDKADACLEEYYYTKDKIKLENALSIYRITDRLVNGIKTELAEIESKLYWRTYSQHLYEHAIKGSFLENDPSAAFYFFEKSRAVLLNDQLNEQSRISSAQMLTLAEVNQKLAALKKEREITTAGSDHYIEIQNGIIANELALTKVAQGIKKNNPLYYQSFFDTSFVSIQKIQHDLLTDHNALVELFTGDSAVYLLVVTAKSSSLETINKKTFDNLSAVFTRYLSSPDLLNREFDSYVAVAHELYQLMFQHVNLPAGRIIISPDGKYFPFEALVTNARPLTYFLEDHAVSYTYSARYLLMDFKSTTSATANSFMGFAPVRFSNLPDLSGSSESLQRIQKDFVNATSYIGEQASKNNFLQEYYKYGVIQLYTHATDSGDRGEPTIYFSDSMLFLSDLLYENKPATNLIVLSACETAGGKIYNSEGVFSFNRQFAALGIPSCVSNLWQVDNQSSYQLTELFYKHMASGLPLDIALQKAKKEFIRNAPFNEKRLPFYWAASILVGQSNMIPLQKPFLHTRVLITGSLLILVLLLSLIWFLKARKKPR